MSYIKRSRMISGRLVAISATLLLLPLTATAGEVWTLEKSVKHAIEVSPVVRAAGAEIEAKQGALSQAGAWPNPSVEFGGSEKLGLEDRSGGNDLTEISFSQPIPIGRLSRQEKQAKAELEASRYDQFHTQLVQENNTASRFHALQLATSKLTLAEEQLKFAKHYQKEKGKKDPLVRYLTPLERKRLDIIKETASQEVATAEGKYSEALSNFKAFMNLPQDSSLEITELKPTKIPDTIENLLSMQEGHAAISTVESKKDAADASISVARGMRFEDPTLTFFRERDTLDGKRQDFNGVMLNVKVPLWDFKNGDVSKAKAESEKAKYELQTVKRNLKSKLYQTHLHLGHLIEQAAHYRTKILVPAKEVLDLTKKGFAAGEVNVLALVDASDTYFDARKRYLELLYESWVETAELRLATGISLLDDKETSSNKSDGAKS